MRRPPSPTLPFWKSGGGPARAGRARLLQGEGSGGHGPAPRGLRPGRPARSSAALTALLEPREETPTGPWRSSCYSYRLVYPARAALVVIFVNGCGK